MSAANGGRHTPGPWIVHGEVRKVADSRGNKIMLYCADIVFGEDDPNGWRGYIASVQSADHIGNGITREEAKSHAHLIAAAPDFEQGAIAFLEYEKAMAAGNDVAAMMHYATASERLRSALTAAQNGGGGS